MTNNIFVCLLFAALCCADLALSKKLPKECAKGPEYWCQSLRNAADCGAVGHCTSTEWKDKDVEVQHNDISDKFVRLFRQLLDVQDLMDDKYLSSRLDSACHDIPYPTAVKLCRSNTVQLEKYLHHVLAAKVVPNILCKIIGMCNNEKLENVIDLDNKHRVDRTDSETGHTPVSHKGLLVGGERCTWGPSYWCSNISTGHECKATHHCIERVWSKMQFKEDTNDICKICTDMVTQARDNLESNDTQELLREVFEGSCKLIPIKLVTKECIKMADEFVPDLVETLASQMNPQAVCSVAGLCNNARNDELMQRYKEELEKRNQCNTCRMTVGFLRKKFDSTSYEDFLVNLLEICRSTGSFSDSCSMLVFKYYEDILDGVRGDFRPVAVCDVAAMCTQRFHKHDLYVFPETQLKLQANGDVPCEFCEQLVIHLRDVFIANTTEIEFYKVLKGLCGQFGSFKSECLSIAEQYYPMIYNYLVSDLKPEEMCSLIGMCGKSPPQPIAPLLPAELIVKSAPARKLIGTHEGPSMKVDKISSAPLPSPLAPFSSPPPPLPLERMFVSLPASSSGCMFCEYILHYLQVEISDTNNEERIKEAVDTACDHLPSSVNGQCKQFVTEYGPAVIALLVQEIDPASVCPALGMCPQTEIRRVSLSAIKSNCPLCLFAVEQLEAVLKDNRTESKIRHALDNLCNHLSDKMKTECIQFVDTYSNQLVEMLIADVDAQEICVYLKLCTNDAADPLKLTNQSESVPSVAKTTEQPKTVKLPKNIVGGDIETNEIPDHTVGGRPVSPVSQKSVCVICEFVMSQIDDQIKDKHNQDDIKRIVHGVCKRMPTSVRAECDQFVSKYADLVISLLEQQLAPAAVCAELKLCDPPGLTQAKTEVLECAVCEAVVMAVKKILAHSDRADRNIVHIIEKSCALLPAKYNDRCHSMLEIYGDSIIHLLEEVGSKKVCQMIELCDGRTRQLVTMYHERKP